jgi:PBSX family phage terminase large subunit
LTTLRKSTLRILLEPEGDRLPVLPLGSYEHNKVERVIQLNSGGTILYTGCDDPLSIRSINAGDVFVDEVSELNEKEYLELLFRLRVNVGGLRLYSATNPASKAHFLYRRFEVEKDPLTKRIIYASALDNIFLPQNNLDWLNQMTGDSRARYVEGRWCDTEKMIYPGFTCTDHVKDISKNYKRYIIGVDYGYSSPSAVLLCGVDEDGKLFVIEEWYKARQLISTIIKKIEGMIDKIGPNDVRIVVDPSAAGLIAECEAKGLPAQKANNEVLLGIDRVRDYIDTKRLIVNSSCINFIREISGYIFDEVGKPVKMEDHTLDALKYVCNYLADYAALYSETRNFYIY